MSRRSLLNLGLSVGESGAIPPDRVLAALNSTRRLRAQLDRIGADTTVALATAALRDATNGDQVIERLQSIIGVEVRLLDGEEEARLCFLGQRAAVWLPGGHSLGIDLGGGSMELAVGGRDQVDHATSLPIGAARLWGELTDGDLLTEAGRMAVKQRTVEAVATCREALGRRFPRLSDRAVVSGGTARALARVATTHARRRPGVGGGEINQVELPADQVAQLAGQLTGMTLEQRKAVPGMPSRRALVVPVGAEVLATAARELGISRFVVSEWGLREGALFDALGASVLSGPFLDG